MAARSPFRIKKLRLRFLPIGLGLLFAFGYADPGPASAAVGVALVLAGMAVRSWAAGHLVKTLHLAASGPYLHLRHPLYLGTLLCTIGCGWLLGGGAALAVASGAVVWFAVHYFPRKERGEAHRLEQAHGIDFVRYRAAVPALVPRFDAWRAPTAATRWSAARYADNNELGTVLGAAGLLVLIALRTVGSS